MTQVRKYGELCAILPLAIFMLTCDGQVSKPTSGILGKLAEFLHGVWFVEDSWLGCTAFGQPLPMGASVDSICPANLDYSIEIVKRAQENLMRFYDIETFPVEIDFYTGIVTDTLIDVFCRGTGQLFADVCATPVSFHAVGRPDPSEWTLVEVIEMTFVGDTCDLDPGETYTMCMRMASKMTRLGDAPTLCE